MDNSIGSDAKDIMKRLQNVHLTESQGWFMKKNIFQEEMRQLTKSYAEGSLSGDVMASINENEEDIHGGVPSPHKLEEEPFDEHALIESDDIVREEHTIMQKLLSDNDDDDGGGDSRRGKIAAVSLPSAQMS